MSTYKLVPNCTVDDAAGLARSNMSAFWGETWWNMLWVDKSLESIIANGAARMPRNLLKERQTYRHQKVIDSTTGQIVGYARWILPDSHKDGWLEAMTPDVSVEDRSRFEAQFVATPWETRKDMDEVDPPVDAQIAKFKPTVPHIKLDYLGVHPEHQHKGIGSILLKSGVEQGSILRLDIYLVAMGSKALAMYLKQRFELLDSLRQDLGPYGRDDVYDTHILIKHPDGHE